MDKMTDRRASRLGLIQAHGSAHRPITDPETRASQARGAPSGDRIAYMHADVGVGSVLSGSEAAALVRVPGASHGIATRPSPLAVEVAHILEWFQHHGGATPEDGE